MEPTMKKKTSLTEMAIKNQKTILIVAVFGIIMLFTGTSYALFTNFDTDDNNIRTIEKNGGKISVSAPKDLITLSSRTPLSNEDGLKKTRAVVFTITNIGEKDLRDLKIKLIKNQTKVSTLLEKNIKYAISIDLGASFTEPHFLLDDNGAILYISELLKGKSQTIYLKVWVSDSTIPGNESYYGSLDFDFKSK